PMIELATAVVGYVDAVDAVIAREGRVFRGGDALEDQRDVVEILEPLHVVPVERGLKLLAGGAGAPGLHEAARQVALATAVRGRAVDLGDVAQHARPEGDRVESLPIAPQGGLGLGAAREVIPRSRRQRELRGAHDLVKRLEPALEVRG